ncbi:WXG100 family type VII secretion target [Actinokineospora pegani]|uniref:WXG100 family type VII secretion target n=1 Tax=Actinokineospora pegani TaxID=2654637 RepID=UPI0012E9BE4A|nr:hypothetical protein [Actinokineospora pegani]
MPYADTVDPIAALNNEANLQGGPSIDSAIANAGAQVQVVNWIWEQVVGEDLVTSIIAPITGDFEKIAVTGKQWDNVCDALQAVRDNMNSGLDELAPHWDGAASEALARKVRTVWTVAIEADAQAAKLVGTAFEKVAEASKKACDQALKLIKKLVNKLLEAIALLPIPVVGWGKAVKTVIDAIEIYNAVLTIINGIKAIIEGCQAVVQGVKDMGSAISGITDIRNVNDALNSANDVNDARTDINAGREQAAGGLKSTGGGVVAAGKNGYNANKHYGEYQQERNPAPSPDPEPVA